MIGRSGSSATSGTPKHRAGRFKAHARCPDRRRCSFAPADPFQEAAGPSVLYRSVVAAFVTLSCRLWNQLFPPSVVGTRRPEVAYAPAEAGSTTNPTQFRYQFILGSDASYEIHVYVMMNSQYTMFSGLRGAYTTSDNSIVSVTQTEQYQITDTTAMTGQWTAQSDSGSAKCSISGDATTLTIDGDDNGQYDTSHPAADTYPSGGGPPTEVTFTLAKVGSKSGV